MAFIVPELTLTMSRGKKIALSWLTERNQNLPLLITITDCLDTILNGTQSEQRSVETRPASEYYLSFPGRKVLAVKELAASKQLIPVNIKLLQLKRTWERAESAQSLNITDHELKSSEEEGPQRNLLHVIIHFFKIKNSCTRVSQSTEFI